MRGTYHTPHATPPKARLVGHRHRPARPRRHAARSGVRQPHLARSRAAAIRGGAGTRSCRRRTRKSRGVSPRAATRSTGTASSTGRARSAWTSARCIAKCARTWRGCRARAIFSLRMRAAGKRLVLLTNSHPIALAVKHEQTGVLDLLDAAATSHEFGAPKEHARFWDAARRAIRLRPGAQPVRRRQHGDARCGARARGCAGCTASGIGIRAARGASMAEHPAVDAVADL